MKKLQIDIPPHKLNDHEFIKKQICRKLHLPFNKPLEFHIIRRSIDARKKVKFILQVAVGKKEVTPTVKSLYSHQSERNVLIVGAGPAGYFAALECLVHGFKPIILERGKDVQTRRKDLRQIQQFGVVNPHSNYCFGEGGAGTYSDGKLYTRSGKRHEIDHILQILVEHGANPDILIDSHPHIGSNKLPNVIKNIRETILQFGGEIHFNAFVTNFLLHNNRIVGVQINHTTEIMGDDVVLATGHSARDIFQLCNSSGIDIEAKPFAMGVRIEHPQALIDDVQYRQNPRDENLPASSYGLVCQSYGRGVFSFCMCPGGIIVPAATAPNETVVNGMSLSRRDSPFANSGIVVAVELEDLTDYKHFGKFAGLEYQKHIEKQAFKYGGDETQQAPAQRLVDFVEGKLSSSLPKTSYIPGVHSAPLHEALPSQMVKRLQDGFLQFGKKMKSYYTNDAQIVGVESRTSSPIRIPRNSKTLMHPNITHLYPCGEGAGYAGGIVSAAMDGQRVVRAIKANSKQ